MLDYSLVISIYKANLFIASNLHSSLCCTDATSPPSSISDITMAAFSIFKLSLLLSLLSNSHHLGLWSGTASNRESVGISPPSCSRIECPSYDVIHVGNGFEIRRYNSTVWMSTSPIQDISLVEATRTGFLQ